MSLSRINTNAALTMRILAKRKVSGNGSSSTLIDRGMKGDCDDAAQLAKWWFKQNGIEVIIQ